MLVDAFHRLYYDSHVWLDTRWLGVPVLKCPLDLWIYQELITELRPGLIVETGTAAGGSALFLACMCDLVGAGRVITIDIATDDSRPQHPRVEYLHGSSVAPDTVAAVAAEAATVDTVLVILDSDHAMPHVTAELHAYAPLVTVGSYLIVEDTNTNGHPVLPDHGPGPHEAVEQFLAAPAGRAFVRDERRERLLMTFNPGGYLQRRSGDPADAQPAGADAPLRAAGVALALNLDDGARR